MFHLRRTFNCTAVSLLMVFAMPAVAENQAETLYQANCLQCHSSETYTKPTRRINAFDLLERQVKRCELSLGLQWFDEEIHAVAIYLNEQFYHFLR